MLENGRKPRTIQRHLQNIKYLLEYSSTCFQSLESSKETLRNMKNEKGIKNNTINNFISTVRMVGHWLQKKDLLSIKYWPKNEFHKGTLSDQEILDIIELPRYNGASHKEHAMYSLFFTVLSYGGMRPGELAKVKVNDVDFGRKEIHVDQKTGPRDVPMHDAIITPLKEYVSSLQGEYLFATRTGGKNRDGIPVIDAPEWGRSFKKRLDILGIRRTNLSVYSLRHSFITRYMEEDINFRKIQKIVGQRKVETILAYEHLVKKDLHDAMKKDRLGRAHTDPHEIVKIVCESIDKYQLYKDRRIDYATVERAKALLWESIKAK